MFLLKVPSAVVTSLFSLNGRPRYIHWGWFLISAANLTVIVLMIALFVVALVLPFPHTRATEESE